MNSPDDGATKRSCRHGNTPFVTIEVMLAQRDGTHANALTVATIA